MRIVYRISAKGIIEVVAPGLRKTICEEFAGWVKRSATQQKS